MKILKNLIMLAQNAVLNDSNTVAKILKITALSVYMDEKVYDKELVTAKEILFEYFEKLDFSETQIQIALSEFESIIESYEEDHKDFTKDKKWLRELIQNSEQSQKNEFLMIVQELFKSDGFIGEEESKFLASINKN